MAYGCHNIAHGEKFFRGCDTMPEVAASKELQEEMTPLGRRAAAVVS